MKWLIEASDYHIWQGFSLELTNNLIFACGNAYRLNGNNGSGKTSFIRKVLIPQLLSEPAKQYLLYFEQQAQSQLDAVNAYASLQKPPSNVLSYASLLQYQLESLNAQIQLERRPVFIVVDECPCFNLLMKYIKGLHNEDVCLVYVSHIDNQNLAETKTNMIKIELRFPGKAVLST